RHLLLRNHPDRRWINVERVEGPFADGTETSRHDAGESDHDRRVGRGYSARSARETVSLCDPTKPPSLASGRGAGRQLVVATRRHKKHKRKFFFNASFVPFCG